MTDPLNKSILDGLLKQLETLGEQLDLPFESREEIAAIAEESIMTNFLVGGRWDGRAEDIGIFSGGESGWPDLAESTKRAYEKKGYKPLSRTLNRNKGLLSTIEVRAEDEGIAFAAGGTNHPYAAIHQYGGTINHPGGTQYGFKTKKDAASGKIQFLKTGTGYMVLGETRPHQIEIPAAPYIVLQNEDIEDFIEVIMEYLQNSQ